MAKSKILDYSIILEMVEKAMLFLEVSKYKTISHSSYIYEALLNDLE